MSYTYQQAIQTLQAQGYEVDAGGIWGPVCQNSWWLYIRSASYTSGKPIELEDAEYAFAYQGVVDSNFATGVASGSGYIAVPNAQPGSGNPGPSKGFYGSYGSYSSYALAFPNWNFTVQESGGSATAFNWNFGDGQTGTGNPATHSYTTAGDYTPYVTATVKGNPVGPFYANPIDVE